MNSCYPRSENNPLPPFTISFYSSLLNIIIYLYKQT